MTHNVRIESVPFEDGNKYKIYYDGDLIGVVCGDEYLTERFALTLALVQYETGDVEGYFPCAEIDDDGVIEYWD